MDRSVDNVLINRDENLTDLISRTRYAHTLMIQRHFFHQIFLSFVVAVEISRTNKSSGSIGGIVVRFISFRINVVVCLEMEPGVVFLCHRDILDCCTFVVAFLDGDPCRGEGHSSNLSLTRCVS